MKILAIETSCDETGAAVIEGELGDTKVTLLSNVVASSLSLHAKTGGIIPEVAAREQIKYIIPTIEKALQDASFPERPVLSERTGLSIDAIAVTIGPGLIGSLLVGVETAKTLAYVWNKPIIPVNHLIGHIYANFVGESTLSSRAKPRTVRYGAKRGDLVEIASSSRQDRTPRNDNITFPALALIVSGGHTDLVLMKNHQKLQWIGGTRDDAAGEAFDKIGRLLGLPYPGGPAIAKAAEKGNQKAFNLPRPMIDSNDFDFSFSGLKTAVLREVKNRPTTNDQRLTANLAASVQQAIVDVLVAKTIKAAQKYKVKSILLGGGVAANQKLREQFELEIRNLKFEIPLSVPPASLCTDNGAMIATAAFFNHKQAPWKSITANPSLHF